MNQRQLGHHSESNIIKGQLTLFDEFNEVEATTDKSTHDLEISKVIIASYRCKKSKSKLDENLECLPARIIDDALPDEELAKLFYHLLWL